MSKADSSFNTDLYAYLEDENMPPPRARHTELCVRMQGPQFCKQKFYTLPASCIPYGCTISTWALINDKSHLRLHCGISLQHVLQDLVTTHAITSHDFLQIIECHEEAVYETIQNIGKLKFSQRRFTPVKIKGKSVNYKNEHNHWIFQAKSCYITRGKIRLYSPSIKLVAKEH